MKTQTHPKFLHSNSTSHVWAFGAIAELIGINPSLHQANYAFEVILDRFAGNRSSCIHVTFSLTQVIHHVPSPFSFFADNAMDPDVKAKNFCAFFST